MLELIEWLGELEKLAHEVYANAAKVLVGDARCAAFLSDLAADEDSHFHLIDRARSVALSQPGFPVSDIHIDAATRSRTELPLRTTLERLKEGHLDTTSLLECVSVVETSELNPIFLYVMNHCGSFSKQFQRIAAVVQQHEDRIRRYFDGLGEEWSHENSLPNLPRVWKRSILIAEDSAPLRTLFKELLDESGQVMTAPNGAEALQHVKDRFFNVVISDVDMPVMDGLEFFRCASELDRDIDRRFIFCTGTQSPEVEALCAQTSAILLTKPFSVGSLFAALRTVAARTL